MRSSNLPGFPSRTIWAPSPPLSRTSSSFFWLLCPLLPRPQYAVFQEGKLRDLEHRFSLIPTDHNPASQLFQILPLQYVLWDPSEPDLEETHGTDCRPSQTSTHSFSGQILFSSVLRPVPLRLLSLKASFVGQTQSAFNNKGVININKCNIRGT